MPTIRRPIEWRRLCALARDLLNADPTIDNLEWGERIKHRLLRLGLTYPTELDAIHRAMRAKRWNVERGRD